MGIAYHDVLYHHQKEGKGILRKVGWSLLLWLIGLTFTALLVLLYSPDPFSVPPLVELETNLSSQGGDAEECDLAVGRWVPDSGGPMYTNRSCRSIPESKNCDKYGKDMGYLDWRWRPEGCELPRFDPERFLRIVRGKKMAFIGDSVARNQFESLLCLLSQVEEPVDLSKDAEDKSRTWRFPSHDFTLLTLWSRFLVQATERSTNGSLSGPYDLHVDRADADWVGKLPEVDFAVVSAGHWFFRKIYVHEGGSQIGCIFCTEPNVTSLSPTMAVRKVFRTALEAVRNCRGCKKGLVTVVRTFSPAHFEHGSWDGGGRCDRTAPMREDEVRQASGESWEMSRAQVEEVGRAAGRVVGKAAATRFFGVVDVTRVMLARGDGHPGLHWNNRWMKGYSDCVHWCLPGPIDVWNELLLALMGKIVSQS